MVRELEREELNWGYHIKMTKVVYTHIRKARKEKTAAKLNETANNF